MIAVDTNVLLRYLIEDNDVQFEKAKKLIHGEQQVLVTDIVIAETIWVLKGKRYQLTKEKIVDVLYALFAEKNIRFEDPKAVWCALTDYANATPVKVSGKTRQADFPDALIVNKAKLFGTVNNIEVAPIYTFDKAALVINGTREP